MVAFFLSTVVPLSVLLPITVGAVHFRKFPFELKAIVMFSLVSGITSGISILLAKRGINNMPVFHVFTILAFITCSLFYRKALAPIRVGKLVVPVIFLFLAFVATSTILWQGPLKFNSYALSFQTVVTIAYSLLLFYRLLGTDMASFKENIPLAWINAGFFLYCSGSLFLFLFPEFLTAPQWVYETGWMIHAVLVLVMYIFFSIAFIKYKKPT